MPTRSHLSSIVNLNLPFGRPGPSLDGTVTIEDMRHSLLLYSESLVVPTVIVKNNKPLFYLTDGTVKSNGQLNRLDLLNKGGGFCLTSWRPSIAQYKDGGYFNDSSLATGRRLVMRRFQNITEAIELSLFAPTEDEAIQYSYDLLGWLEKAANYWESSWSSQPVYLVHRAPREQNTRYSLVTVGSVPDLSDPHNSPFFTGERGSVVITGIVLRLEHGLWTDYPPGESEPVPISSFRTWTVAGWEELV